MEILRTSGGRRRKRMLRLLGEYGVQRFSEQVAPEAFRLARIYRRAGVVPGWAHADSQLLGWATAGGVEVLVSWNRRQLVRLKTRRQVAIINTALGYEPVDVQMPTEVLGEAQDA
jgi:hypothetical protein